MRSVREPLRRYGFAVGAVLCALLLTPLLRDYLQPLPSALFAAAVLAGASYGGIGPGLLAILLTLATAHLVTHPPPGGPAPDRSGLAGGVLFILTTLLLGWQSSARLRARAVLRFLADAGKSLAGSLDQQATLGAVARLPIPDLADGCLVDLLADDGRLQCVAAAHADPVLENKLRLAAQCQPPSPDARRGVADVVRTGQSLVCRRLSDALLRELAPEEPRRQVVRALGVSSLLIVPLRARDRMLGALTLLSSRRWRRFRRADLTLARELAQRAALAIDNARLYRQARDMEEALRRRAEQLSAADRSKDEFLAVVAHELRGPLGALRSAVAVVRQYGPGTPLSDAPQGIMARQVDALARLVDDLLDVARIREGKIALHRQPLDLNDVLQAAAATARPLIEARRHTLTVTLPRGGVRVEGDAQRLEQVFVNLLTNAAKYTEPGGHVWLSAAAEEGTGGPRQAVVSVRDTGVGMAPEFLAHAFDLFAQGSPAPDRSQGGLGIGLSVVRRLVEMHEGTVEAHSEGRGRGSEFVVRLPLLQVEGGGRSSPSTLHPPPVTRRVLIVDDNADAAESLAMLLRLRGHDARIAANGPTALAVAREYVPDAVLLDIGLPGMDGHEVGRQLRRQPGLDRVLLVAVMGRATEEDSRRSREAGFDHHFVKPVDAEHLDQVFRGGR